MEKVLMFQGLLFPCASQIPVTSTEYRKRKIIKATVVQKDKVLDCLDVPESSFVYQMNNACCKSYTLESV